MSIATDMLAGALAVIEEMGTTCTIVEVAGTYATDGTVAETLTTHTAVKCSDLVDESKRYAAQDTSLRCSGTFYVPASGLGFTPATGNRITYQTRSFEALAVFPYRVQGTAVAFRIDVAEVGA